MRLEDYKTRFEKIISGLSDEPQSLLKVRKKAFNNFMRVGFPSTKNESWQYTDLSPIIKSQFDIFKSNSVKVNDGIFEKQKIPNSNRIIITDGRLNEDLSNFSDHIAVKNISNILSARNAPTTKIDANAFVELNTAFTTNGYFIEVSENYGSEQPLHIINVISDANTSAQNDQLNIINVNQNCSVFIIEEYIYPKNANVFNNIVNRIELKENSSLNYAVFQDNNPKLLNLNHYFVKQSNDSIYNAQFITKNGSLIRNEMDIQIDGNNCESNISGLNLLDGKDHIENYTNVIHNKPHCNSRQLFKYILKDSSEGVFNGLVKVQPGAQKTDSQQTNKNIILSDKALMNSNPQLEIYADDVKCSHGSATGELDEDAIFYLRSRGLDITTAKSLLIEGFAKEILEQINNESFRERISSALLKWLAN